MSSNASTAASTATPGSSASASTAASSSGSSVSIPQTAAAGGLTVTQPPQTATSFFKIAPSNTITFGWNFTSLLLTPTHLTVSAVCENGNTYPVGPTDGIIDGTATSIEWDLYSYQQAHQDTPLAANTYTLQIYGDDGPTQGLPGRLAENTAVKFALYFPQSYTPIASGWSCIDCSSAWSSYVTHPATISLVATLVIMFLSGYSIIRQAWH